MLARILRQVWSFITVIFFIGLCLNEGTLGRKSFFYVYVGVNSKLAAKIAEI